MPEQPTPLDDSGGTWTEFESARRRFLAARAAETALARLEGGWRLPAAEPPARGAAHPTQKGVDDDNP